MSNDDDLFGSDLELDDADAKPSVDVKHKSRVIQAATDDNDDDDDLFGSEEEPEPIPDQKPVLRTPVKAPKIQKDFGPSRVFNKPRDDVRLTGTGTELCTVKMPTWVDADRNEFDAERIRQEIANCSGDASHIAHKIRWRMTQDEEGNTFRESNARLVTWSDGSVQMLVGSLVFDIVKSRLPENLHYLYDQTEVSDDSRLQQCRAAFTSKLLVKPTQNLVVHAPKRKKVAHTPLQTAKKIVTTTDPEKEVEEKIRQYRLKEMRESARERAQRFVPPPDSLNADFLEYSEEEEASSDEDMPRRRVFDDDGVSQRLMAAKKGEDIKGRAIIKKKERTEKPEKVAEERGLESEGDEDVAVHHSSAAKRRHVIEESDSD